ncbi:MAG TPA: lanthionine synthetase LanC family protein [Luteibaculaceae bacterium]|nr:lanthionine synthetase LanC family protein [Luteibaculaceae bacterium]
MKTKVLSSVDSIIQEIKSNTDFDHSILHNLGNYLLIIDYSEFNNLPIDPTVSNVVNYINDYTYNSAKNQTLAEGYPSFFLILSHLLKKGLIDTKALKNVAIQEIFLAATQLQLKFKNYDLLYGATGILHSFLSFQRSGHIAKQIIDCYVSSLLNNKIYFNGGFALEDYYYRIREGKSAVNMGLAHGLPSIIKLLLEIQQIPGYKNRKDIGVLITGLCDFLIYSSIENKKISNYGIYWNLDHPQLESSSRLGWCYGDLGIGLILYQAGIFLNDGKYVDHALKILTATTYRRSKEDTQVGDAGLCHGSAGIMHIYNKLWMMSGELIFKNARDFWLSEVLNFTTDNGIEKFLKYNPIKKVWENDVGFLEGSSGVGLALLSYVTNDVCWDYTLMLNDLKC